MKSMKNKSGTTVDAVYEEIKRMMYLGLLAPGQKLVYQSLASKLNTSNTPVIQALRGLERANLVKYEQNKGYFVQEITVKEAEELFQTREALETFVVPLIIQNLNDNRLDEISHALGNYENARGTEHRRDLMLRDAEIHLKMVEVSQNMVIYGLLQHVFEQVSLKYKPEYFWEHRIDEAIKEHREILGYLAEGEVKKTKELIRRHIRKGKEHIAGSLKSPIGNHLSAFRTR